MFDFFRDIVLEAQGIDSSAAAKERSEKRKVKKFLKKKERYIFSKGVKVLVYVFGIMYLIIAGLGLLAMKEAGILNVYHLIRSVFLVSCDIAALACLATGKKKAEVIALILVVVFLITLYFSMLLM